MILAIDFDGTLHTGAWRGIGIPTPYAVEKMQNLKQAGNYLIIWTCREGKQKTERVNWLLEHKIPLDRINDIVLDHGKFMGISQRRYMHIFI